MSRFDVEIHGAEKKATREFNADVAQVKKAVKAALIHYRIRCLSRWWNDGGKWRITAQKGRFFIESISIYLEVLEHNKVFAHVVNAKQPDQILWHMVKTIGTFSHDERLPE